LHQHEGTSRVYPSNVLRIHETLHTGAAGLSPTSEEPLWREETEEEATCESRTAGTVTLVDQCCRGVVCLSVSDSQTPRLPDSQTLRLSDSQSLLCPTLPVMWSNWGKTDEDAPPAGFAVQPPSLRPFICSGLHPTMANQPPSRPIFS
jgi:hypothetical protein